MLDTQGKFFLGRVYDPVQNKLADKPLLYDPADLTTHAVVTGMTGSGKTGLCITLLEEAALQGLPALIVDPKGDLTNLLLHFPNLAPQDFQPWLDAETVRRQGKSMEQAIQEANDRWGHVVNDITEITITPKKSAVYMQYFGVAWVPYYLVDTGAGVIEIPAFGEE